MTKHTFLRALPFVATLAFAALGALAPHLVSVTAHAQRRSAPTTAIEMPAAAEGVVNIQTATADELQRLPGIGPSKAAAIIAFRERTAFRRVEDILRVRGIGRATFRRLRPYLTVSGQTTLTTDVTSRRAPQSDDTPEEPPAQE
ncbi:MAG: ComEA family DNA-binding protein [Sandaracinaceae bacterium]|nr:ComEA family DNA-binding protein [Sandaracinaceae bacterium]